MKVAYLSPLPPEPSGVADYSALLLPALRERVRVEVVRRGWRRPPRDADVCLYHVGNNPDAHGWIVDALRRRPGVVVLHEFVLHHLVAGMTLGRGDGEGYRGAMARDHGVAGRLLAHGVIDGVVPPVWEDRPEDFPLASFVLDFATGLVVHSRYVERRAREAGYEGRIWRVPMPAWPSPALLPDRQLPTDRRPIVSCLGKLNATKRVPQLLEAFARLRARFPNALLVLAGETAPSFELGARLARLGLRPGEDVAHLDYVAETRLWSLIAESDVCVNLRWPTMGETSGAAIRVLSLGKPLVVSDVGWFSELPDAVAVKVPVDEWEVDTLAAALEVLAANSDLRATMGEAALAYARREHDLERAADLYLAALEEGAGGELIRTAVLSEIAEAAADVGIDPADAQVAEIAARAREVGV